MTTLELRSNIHNLIDKITDEAILSKFYDLLSRTQTDHESVLWNSLTQEEREELLQIEQESREAKNLISHSSMQLKHKKWL